MSTAAWRPPSDYAPPTLTPLRLGNAAPIMKSPVVKRSIVIAGHKTSVSVEDAFWKGLKEIARGRALTVSEMVSMIQSEHSHKNLSSAIRLFVLDHYRSLLGAVAAEDARRDTAARAHPPAAVTCYPSAPAVRQDHPDAWPSWTLRAPGHEGTRCWYPTTRAVTVQDQRRELPPNR
jgi:predicted DNA-binding ribbon-helix-helix protein